MSKAINKYSPEVRERALQFILHRFVLRRLQSVPTMILKIKFLELPAAG